MRSLAMHSSCGRHKRCEWAAVHERARRFEVLVSDDFWVEDANIAKLRLETRGEDGENNK